MTKSISQISTIGRQAVIDQDWETVAASANSLLSIDNNNPEGFFLMGLVEKISSRPVRALSAFKKTLELDAQRYDAAIELANQYSIARQNQQAADLLLMYEDKLVNSPMYLDLAGTVYTEIGLPEKAWPLYKKSNELQPGIDLFQANLAACSVYLGKIDDAREIYQKLLKRFPNHQRNHYHLARLSKAKNTQHIEQMKKILQHTQNSPDKNIFLYYALGKELEDLGKWKESFQYYKSGGDAVTDVAAYNVADDISLIEKIKDACNNHWISDSRPITNNKPPNASPIFIVGLPRTGTTLTERIISSHSQVETLGETLFLQMVLRRESGVQSIEAMNTAIIESVAKIPPELIANGYMDSISYRLGGKPFFIDKLPLNFLYLGFIAKAWPNARIVHLKRNPMDACFSMFKQVFTWAYKFSYSLENLGKYYVAYDRLSKHWKNVLGDRLIEVEYEKLVADTEKQTRNLLEKLALDFEDSCLDFDQNQAPSATASSVQIREKTHSRSVNKWEYFKNELQPLKAYLKNAGIEVE